MVFDDEAPCDGSILTNARQADAIAKSRASIEAARSSLRLGMTPDAVLVDVEAAMEALGEATGRVVREDITNRIFERFCVGKIALAKRLTLSFSYSGREQNPRLFTQTR